MAVTATMNVAATLTSRARCCRQVTHSIPRTGTGTGSGPAGRPGWTGMVRTAISLPLIEWANRRLV
jgi:hypothetical protein